MPLYENTETGERCQSVRRSRNDKRLAADAAWRLVDEGAEHTDDSQADPEPRPDAAGPAKPTGGDTSS